MRVKHLFAAALFTATLTPSSASADVVTRTFDFTATGFNTSLGTSGAPDAVVSGSFSVSFDSSITSLNQVATTNSLSIPFSGVALFSFFSSDGSLFIGGNDVMSSTRNTNDFALSIRDASSSLPTSNAFNYSRAGFDDVASTRTVLLRAGGSIGPVPEPMTWTMMIVGFGAVGISLRFAKRRLDRKFDEKIRCISIDAYAQPLSADLIG